MLENVNLHPCFFSVIIVLFCFELPSKFTGNIQAHLSDDGPDPKTPLQQKLDEFGEQLSKVVKRRFCIEGNRTRKTLLWTPLCISKPCIPQTLGLNYMWRFCFFIAKTGVMHSRLHSFGTIIQKPESCMVLNGSRPFILSKHIKIIGFKKYFRKSGV